MKVMFDSFSRKIRFLLTCLIYLLLYRVLFTIYRRPF